MFGTAALLPLSCGESVCDLHMSNTAHAEATCEWVLLFDLVESSPASQDHQHLIVLGIVPP